ncbi:MAG: glycosyltransferase [Candidatus Yanofskybacteria bacterium]|nr:glycosyltransferase [Candidatus Yanofskybacteria bacterium]
MIKKIIYLSNTRLDYSLNAVLIKGLRENSVQVADAHVQKGVFGFINALSFYRRNSKDADLVIIGYNSQPLAFFLKPFCRKKIVYNAVLSEYERMVISRQLARKISLKGIYYWLLDFLAVHSADLILVESNEQANFFNKLFKVSKKKLCRSWIGSNEDKFYYDPAVPKQNIFTVLFRGALMPEAGAEYVIKAAKILESENINFVLIGGGLLMEKTKKLIKDIAPKNLKHITDYVPDDILRTMMQSCHISLGQLSHHVRLKRTLPHKVYETLSMRLPYLTSANTGVLELLTPDETCLLCNPADEKSLADKILWIRNNYFVAQKIAENGYELYQKKLKSAILAKNLLDKIETV